MSQNRTQSLAVVLEEVRAEREAQREHFESLDSKAGIILGFAGALVALSPAAAGILIDIGRAFGVVAAGLSLYAFCPRSYQLTNLHTLRSRYLAAAPGFTQLRILDSQIEMFETTLDTLRSKANRLKAAMVALAVAAAIVAVGLIVGYGGGDHSGQGEPGRVASSTRATPFRP